MVSMLVDDISGNLLLYNRLVLSDGTYSALAMG